MYYFIQTEQVSESSRGVVYTDLPREAQLQYKVQFIVLE